MAQLGAVLLSNQSILYLSEMLPNTPGFVWLYCRGSLSHSSAYSTFFPFSRLGSVQMFLSLHHIRGINIFA